MSPPCIFLDGGHKRRTVKGGVDLDEKQEGSLMFPKIVGRY